MKRSCAILSATVVALSAVLTGGSAGQAQAPSAGGGTLTVSFPYQPDTMDPAVGGQTIGFQILRNVLDTLVWMTPRGKIVPDLATRWKISNGGKTYTFFLRHGVKFQDGTPFNAQAYVDYFNRVEDPATHSTSAIGGLGSSFQSAVASGAYTLVLHLKAAFAPLLTNLAQPQEGVVSPTAVKQYGTSFGEHVIGTGPFTMTDWTKGSSMTLTRNTRYNWAPPVLKHRGPAFLARIVYHFVQADQARVDELQTGQAQIADSVPGIQFKVLKGNPSFHAVAVPLGGTGVYGFINNSKWPTNQIAVRKAILYSIDRPGVVKLADSGAYPLVHGPLQRGMIGYDDARFKSMYPYNPKLAASILTKAGWKKVGGIWSKGGKKLSLQIISIPVEDLTSLAQAIQGYLQKAGMEVSLQQLERSAWYTAWQNGQENLSTAWLSGLDSDDLRLNWVPTQPFDWNKYSNPTVTRDLNSASIISNPKARAKLYLQAEEIIMKDAATIPLRENDDLVVMSSRVHNAISSGGNLVFTGVTLK